MIKKLIEEHAPTLQVPEGLDAEALLWAIYRCERYDKHNRVPRFEPSYAPGGYYFSRSSLVRREYAKWGNWACCSYSNFQIMYITAVELGYEGPPLALDHDSVAITWVCRYLNHRVFAQGARTVEEVADAYNSGTYRNSNVPEKYVAKFRRKYDRALERKNVHV